MRFTSLIFKFIPSRPAYAHCDIPCGVYDPTPLQIAAHTVLRMTQLLGAASAEGSGEPKEKTLAHDVARLTRVKEKHGELVEDELGTLENDYFKEEHYKENPELKSLISEAVKLSIKARQEVSSEIALELLDKALLISEIFYKTKNVTPIRVKSLYPTGGEIVTYKA